MSKKAAEASGEPRRSYRLDAYAPYIVGGIYLLLFILSVVMEVYFFIELHPGPEGWRALIEAENLRKIWSGFFPLLYIELFLALVAAIIFSFSYYKLIIQDDCFELHAYFRKPFKFYYSDVKYCGIDSYETTKYGKLWYIYFHRDLFPRAERHRQKTWAYERRNINLSYNERLYDSLVYYLPKELSVMLRSCHGFEHIEYGRKWGDKYAEKKYGKQ